MKNKSLKSKSAFKYLPYPLFIISSILLYELLKPLGVILATHIPIALSAIGIALLERIMPANKNWIPLKKDVFNDVIYLVFIQMILPNLLIFIIIITLLKLEVLTIFTLKWLDGINIYFQAILLLLIADFFVYWVHKALHENKFLWPIHEIHHSPNKMYFLNVCRFHPIERGVYSLIDSIPFIILGAKIEVFALFFVFYSVHGFFQHSNIDIRLGWLNYIISGPELHRWHHSSNQQYSQKNYGRNLSIYDLVFKSLYLPKNKKTKRIGCDHSKRPRDFITQIVRPFLKN